jgi:hypothetical protein
MSGILSQITDTPNLQQKQVYLAKAQTIYTANKFTELFGANIGQPISATSPFQNSIRDLQNPSIDPEKAKQYPLALMFGCTSLDANAKIYEQAVAPLSTGDNPLLEPDIVIGHNKELQDQILQLTQTRNNLKENRDIAVLRDSVLRSGNDSISNHQVYLLGRPLRPASIPFLWALSVLFIGLGLLVFYTFFPYTIPPIDILLFEIYLFFASPYVWSVLFGLASIVILFLSLHIAGIL